MPSDGPTTAELALRKIYLAPVLAWNLPSGWTLRVSPGFGLNANSHRFLLRFGVSREFAGFGRAVSRLFGAR